MINEVLEWLFGKGKVSLSIATVSIILLSLNGSDAHRQLDTDGHRAVLTGMKTKQLCIYEVRHTIIDGSKVVLLIYHLYIIHPFGI